MSKGLEALKEIRGRLVNEIDFLTTRSDTLRIKYCINTKEDIERYVDNIIGVKTVGKELKALEIIKYKQVNVYSFIKRKPKTFEEYQDIDDNVEQLSEVSLSKEEYDLLKEVLL